VAFPAMGSGVGGFPLDESARVTVRAVREELPASPTIEHVIFAMRGAAAYQAFEAALAAPEEEEVTPAPDDEATLAPDDEAKAKPARKKPKGSVRA
jgi:hypothetical protein